MYSLRIWSCLAAILLALSCALANVQASRLSPVSLANAGQMTGLTGLRQLQGTPKTEEVSASKRKRVKKGSTVAATATCPTGMTVSEVLECSSTSSKFTKHSEKDKLVDGDVVGVTCRYKNTKGSKITILDKPRGPASTPPSPEPSPFPEGVFRMTTRFLEDEGFNLEGNRICDTCTLGGAAFMSSDSRIPTGMQWKANKLSNGFYHLTTVFQEPEGKVLEGNRRAPSSFLKGAAFMSPDKKATGTMWKAIPAGGGYYFLTTKFLEDEDLVLEGNRVAKGSTLGGAAFMSPDKATGTQWKFIEL